MAKSEPGQDLVSRIIEDMGQPGLSAKPEFPVSSMSSQLAISLDGIALPNGNGEHALDVGTGCGIDSFFLHRRGFKSILAIDSNELAIELAFARADRLGIESKLIDPTRVEEALNGSAQASSRVLFSPIRLQELVDLVGSKVRFDLIVFNPPSYFYVRKPDLSSPAASGVYTGDARTALDINESLMFQFFKKLVLPLLTPGGDVICTWPGLKRRVVEVNPVAEKRGPAAHPADVLESWLDITIECPDRNVDRFYRHTAVVNIDYGLGSSFWSNLDHALQNPRCYSTLVKPADWKHGNHPTFRFGVLRLRRAESDPNRFEASPGEGGANE